MSVNDNRWMSALIAGPLSTFAIFCAENWLPQAFPGFVQQVPWGWLTLVLLGVWGGAELTSAGLGRSWLVNTALGAFSFAEFSQPVYEAVRPTGFRVLVDVTPRRTLKNVVFIVDHYEQKHYVNGTSAWCRVAQTRFGKKAMFNKGETKRIPLVSLIDPKDKKSPPCLDLGDAGHVRHVIHLTHAAGRASKTYSFWIPPRNKPSIAALPYNLDPNLPFGPDDPRFAIHEE